MRIDDFIVDGGFINDTSFWLQTQSKGVYYMIVGEHQWRQIDLNCDKNIEMQFDGYFLKVVCIKIVGNNQNFFNYLELDLMFETRHDQLSINKTFKMTQFNAHFLPHAIVLEENNNITLSLIVFSTINKSIVLE